MFHFFIMQYKCFVLPVHWLPQHSVEVLGGIRHERLQKAASVVWLFTPVTLSEVHKVMHTRTHNILQEIYDCCLSPLWLTIQHREKMLTKQYTRDAHAQLIHCA